GEELADIHYLKGIGQRYIISSLAEAKDFGIEFYCAQELTDDSIYETDYSVELRINYGLYYLDGGEYVEYSKEVNSYEDILGKPIKLGDDSFYTIAGVVKTNYKDYFDDSLTEYKTPPAGVVDAKLWQAEKEYAIRYLLKQEYCTQNYVNKRTSVVAFNRSSEENFTIKAETKRVSYLNKLGIWKIERGGYVATEKGFVDMSSLTLLPNEIIVDNDFYNLVFQDNVTYDEYFESNFPEADTLKKIPSHLGESVTLSVSDPKWGTAMDGETFIIAGVAINRWPQPAPDYSMYVSQSVMMKLAEFGQENAYALVKLGSYKQTLSLLKNLRAKYVVAESV
ncbi:MAG: hypothetical protein K2O39_06845, partial [Clostridiales bacterium]|nr:hypothetical protein [Clostridiales bacterium]